MMRPVKVASKSLYETSAVSLFARLPTPTLLAARGFSTRRLYVTHAVMLIFPADFRAKEKLLAVYLYRCIKVFRHWRLVSDSSLGDK